MQPRDTPMFPRMDLLVRSAEFWGVDPVYTRLNAVLNAALAFAHEAEAGAWKEIFLSYGADGHVLTVNVTPAFKGGYMLTLSQSRIGEARRQYTGGLSVWLSTDGQWALLVGRVGDKDADASEFLETLGTGDGLTLTGKEVSERTLLAA